MSKISKNVLHFCEIGAAESRQVAAASSASRHLIHSTEFVQLIQVNWARQVFAKCAAV